MRKHIFVTGHGRHGKDTVADLMTEMGGYRCCDSSQFVCEKAVFPHMRDSYATWQECYADRHQHRTEWYNLISAYNVEGHELAYELFKNHDVYTGLRNIRELEAAYRHPEMKPLVIWVDALRRLPPEPGTSLTIGPEHADYRIDNNSDLAQLRKNTSGALMFIALAQLWETQHVHFQEQADLTAGPSPAPAESS